MLKHAARQFFVHEICTVHTFILLGTLLLYSLITWPPPILLMKWIRDFTKWQDGENQLNASVGYIVLAWFHHISDLAIRFAMGAVTRLVMVMWSSGEKELRAIEETSDKKTTKFSKIAKNYKEKGKVVAALQDLFQEWFVMTWFTYIIRVNGNFTLVIKSAFDGLFSVASHRSWFHCAHLINDIAAFFILYLCGGLMNHYHQKYRDTLEEVQESILSNSDVLSECIQQKADLIPSKPKYKFIPSLCGLPIPLDNGFGFSLVFAPFVLSLVPSLTKHNLGGL